MQSCILLLTSVTFMNPALKLFMSHRLRTALRGALQVITASLIHILNPRMGPATLQEYITMNPEKTLIKKCYSA